MPGWPFTPDMVWMNLQTIALYHWKTAINKKGFVARCEPSKPNPLVQFFMPTVSANEPGCDDLHWLDGTVLRFCCDVHDYCLREDSAATEVMVDDLVQLELRLLQHVRRWVLLVRRHTQVSSFRFP